MTYLQYRGLGSLDVQFILEIKRIIREHHRYGKKLSEAFKEIELAVNEAQTADLEWTFKQAKVKGPEELINFKKLG